MNTTQLQQLIQERYQTLSPNAQKAFETMNWATILTEVAEKYALNETQIINLGTETTLVLLGIISTTEYKTTLEKELARPKDISEKIITEITTRIIDPIEKDLSIAHEEYNEGARQKTDTNTEQLPLSEATKQALEESNYGAKLARIGQEQVISLGDMKKIEDATILYLKGGMQSNTFEQTIADILPPEKARLVLLSINDMILAPMRTYIQTRTTPSIPVPPYKTQSSVLATAGIEMVESIDKDTQERGFEGDKGSFSESGISVVEKKEQEDTEHLYASNAVRKNVLEGIENPQKTRSLAQEKMESITTTTKKDSDYSIPKMTPDAYREPIS
jgi:hypothetical protein